MLETSGKIPNMNLEKLKQAEEEFFDRYPEGFENPDLIRIRSKHNLNNMFELAQDSFTRRNFRFPELIVENIVKVISRSSLIARFEKPRFRDFAYSLPLPGKNALVKGLYELLHVSEKLGFNRLLEILHGGNMAKWSLITICQAYYHPTTGVFVKPSTTKRIIEHFELDDLYYQPAPTWEFYEDYRATLSEMKSLVDPSLSPYNIAFTGFLMLSIP